MAHVSALGSWFFQAIVESPKLTRMVNNAETAHLNKPRSRLQIETSNLPDSWIFGVGGLTATALHQFDESYRVILTGVRIIRPTDAEDLSASANGSDVGISRWWGDPALVYPIGPGVGPFVRRPVVTVSACEFIIDQAELGSSRPPDWQSFDMGTQTVPYTNDYRWVRAYPGRPFGVDHRGRPGPADLTDGLRLFVMVGRLGATAPDNPGDEPGYLENANFKGLFVHWMAQGFVRAY